MVDRAVLADKIAAVRDAVARIRETMPPSAEELAADRTRREVVVLNLFVPLQESLAVATHWLADAGLDMPQAYADVFRRLGERGLLDRDLAARLAAAAGLRNLIAHRYAALDWRRVHELATTRLDDLLALCEALGKQA